MLTAINVAQRIEFSSPRDTGETKTIFILRPLSGLEMLEFRQFVKDGQINISGDYIVKLLNMSIVEVKNLNGLENRDHMDIEKVLKILDIQIITELIAEIGKLNNLREQDRKN